MKIGAAFPQFEGAVDFGAIRAFAQAVEDMGFDYILLSDHVLDVTLTHDNDWNADDSARVLMRDPFVFGAFLAGCTKKLGFSTAITILPQRQTALVAKQAADLDHLCGGRFRFGIGVGWNPVEYEALNMSFKDRGNFMEEQIAVLRELWTKPKVTLKTKYHTINNAGLFPMPTQQPIPIWIGGADLGLPNEEKLLRRIARMADGWIPHMEPNAVGKARVARLHSYCREYGRPPIGFEGFISIEPATEGKLGELTEAWRDMGAAYVGVNTTSGSLKGVDQHLKRLQAYRKAVPA
jgi:probable F420-dependent oxidoreductase